MALANSLVLDCYGHGEYHQGQYSGIYGLSPGMALLLDVLRDFFPILIWMVGIFKRAKNSIRKEN
jgi:uncharacterized membrane protein